MCACRPSTDCEDNVGWPAGDGDFFVSGYEGCPNTAEGGRRSLADANEGDNRSATPAPKKKQHHPNSGKTSKLGQKLGDRARSLGEKKAQQRQRGEELPPLKLPSLKELQDEDCVEWHQRADEDTNSVECKRHHHTYWQARAAQKRLKLLLEHHSVKDIWEMNKDGDVPETFPYLTPQYIASLACANCAWLPRVLC